MRITKWPFFLSFYLSLHHISTSGFGTHQHLEKKEKKRTEKKEDKCLLMPCPLVSSQPPGKIWCSQFSSIFQLTSQVFCNFRLQVVVFFFQFIQISKSFQGFFSPKITSPTLSHYHPKIYFLSKECMLVGAFREKIFQFTMAYFLAINA